MASQTDMVHLSFPIFKTEITEDGDIVVYGRVTDGSVDADHQIVNSTWSGKALSDWLDTGGNMRVQHSPFLYPAGKGLALDIDKDGDGGHFLKALVVEDTAKKLVSKGVLRDFSVGILDPVVRGVGQFPAIGGEIYGGRIGEVSLVDRGSNKNSGFQIAKSAADGTPQLVAKMQYPSPAQVFPGGVRRTRYDPFPFIGKKITASGKIVDSSGKDRSMVAEEDFAGPGKTYPIHTQDDVSDAASLAHHADNPAQVRAKIRRIANRKWPGMDLPPSLDGDKASKNVDTSDEGKGPFPGAAAPFGPGGKKRKKNKVTKGDAKPDDDGDEDTDLPDDDEDDDTPGKVEKRANWPDPEAASNQPGKKTRPGGKGMGVTPAAAGGAQDKTMTGLATHREPDGGAVHALEADAGIPSHGSEGPDEPPGWTGKASWSIRRAHDLVCPAFKSKRVIKTYSVDNIAAVLPVRELQSHAMQALSSGQSDLAGQFLGAVQAADSVKRIDGATLLNARKAYPSLFGANDTSFPHPAMQQEIRPGQFSRGFLGGDVTDMSASAPGSPHPGAPVHHVNAGEFSRGYLGGDVADMSPSSGTQASHLTASLGQAATAMARFHDQVSQIWPDLCPVGVSQRDYTRAEGHTGISTASSPTFPSAPGESAITKAQVAKLTKRNRKLEKRLRAAEEEVAILGSLPDPDLSPHRGVPAYGLVDPAGVINKSRAGGDGDDETDPDYLAFVQSLAASGDPTMRLNAGTILKAITTTRKGG